MSNESAIGELLQLDEFADILNSPGIAAAVEQHRPSNSKRAKVPTPPRGTSTSSQPKRVRPALLSRFDCLRDNDEDDFADASAADRIAAEGDAVDNRAQLWSSSPTSSSPPLMPGAENGNSDLAVDDLDECEVSTSAGARTRSKAFLVAEDVDGLARRLAFGEYREEEGIFAVAPGGVLAEGMDVDVAGLELGSYCEGGLLSFDDLYISQLDFEWVEDEAPLEQPTVEVDEALSAPVEDVAMDAVSAEAEVEETSEQRWRDLAGNMEGEMQWWRERACELEDEVQYQRDVVVGAQGQAYADMLMTCDGAEHARVLVEVTDPNDKRKMKHVSVEELLRDCASKHERPPILTPTERVRIAKQKCGAYKARYGELSADLDARIKRLQECHRTELQQRDATHAFAMDFQQRSLRGQAANELRHARHAFECELAARASRAATWTGKRNNMTRACIHSM
jgi:hypothetical protein